MDPPQSDSMERLTVHYFCVYLIFTICAAIVFYFGILNVSNDTCEMNLTLWMQLEFCAIFAWPALIFLVQVCTACFKCHCLFERVRGLGALAAIFKLPCLQEALFLQYTF